jgi:Concanavalin A-like lectin/glucanases superfamily
MANISVRTPTTGIAGSGAGFNITLPTGVAVNDLLVLVVGNANTTGPNAPTGWTKINTYSAGSTQSVTVFTAQYSVSLTLAFTNASSVACWTCGAYYAAGAYLTTYGAVNTNSTTNNNALPLPTTTTTGTATDYEILAYCWASTGLLTAASGQTKDSPDISNTVSVALTHNNTNPLPANTTTAAFATLISGTNNRKSAVALLLMQIPVFAPTQSILNGEDFHDATLDTNHWTAYGGTVTTSVANGLALAVPGTSGVYVGVIGTQTAAPSAGIATEAWLDIPTLITPTTGFVQSFQLQIDGSNNIELAQVDSNLTARTTVAGTVNTFASIAFPAVARFWRISYYDGVWYWFYATGWPADTTAWILMARATNPWPGSSVQANLLSGAYQAISAQTARYEYFNVTPPPQYHDIPPVASVGQSIGGNYARLVTADAPIGWWRLGDPSGITAVDSSGRSHNGTYAATGVTLNQSGSLAGDTDSAATFAGTTGATGSVSIPAHADWRPAGGGWTMEAWVNPTSLGPTQEVIRIGGGDGWFLRVNGTNVGSLWSFGGGNFITPEGGTVPAANVWTHIAATYDGAFVRHYVNGSLRYRVAETRALAPSYTGNLGIACQDPSSGGEFFLGKLDEVAVYNKALTPAQISAHYAAGINPITVIGKSLKHDISSVSSAGVATATGVPTRKIRLTGSSAGVASVGVTINTKKALVVISAGKATVAQALTAKRVITGTSVAKATDVGQPARRKALFATSNGVATTTGDVIKTPSLFGEADGVATVTGQVMIRSSTIPPVQSDGEATTSGFISRKLQIAGTSTGTSTASVVLTTKKAIAGNSAGIAVTGATIQRLRSLIGSATGVAVASLTAIQRKRSLVVSTTGVAITSSPPLLTKRSISGTSRGIASTSSVLKVKRAIRGTSNGRSTCNGRVINISLVLWNGSTFVLVGNHPVVLWDQAEFELQVEEGESDVDYVAYKLSTDQFNPVQP